MFRKQNLVLTLTVLLALALVGVELYRNKANNKLIAPADRKTAAPTTGAEDRLFWAKTLYKIAYPVVHNLAQGTLHQQMPLETPEGYINIATECAHLEAVGRTMSGVAPWLALPDDNTEEGKLRKSMRDDLLKGIRNGVDPSNPDYLNFRVGAQAIVDGGCMAVGFLLAMDQLWKPLDTVTKRRMIEELKTLRDRSGPDNNWVFLAAVREAFLYKVGEKPDIEKIKVALDRIPKWYKGDGWYSDGDKFSIDYYNSHVIHPVIVDLLRVTQEMGLSTQDDYDRAVHRMTRHAEFLERVISPEGTYPVFGRTITYRTGAFRALSQTALLEKLPEHVEPAQVRCALTAVMHNLYDHAENFDAKGWLVLGYNGHQPVVADVYTSTGSLYMATQGFLALGLPATNRFWTDPAADWTSKRAWQGRPFKRDYHVEY